MLEIQIDQKIRGKRVALGLSGGVDSSVAAAILVQQGYEATAFYIEAYNEPGCRSDQDKKDALKVALQLGIPFETVDLRKEYREKVIEYFYHEYEMGRTPNPDIVCNREIKFGIFYDQMIGRGYDYVATGHYARVVAYQGLTLLGRPKDLAKDQSYFLWQVEPAKLAHVLFPLGDLTKQEVRAKAKKLSLPTAEKPDSMGVCMIGEVSVTKFLREKLGEKLGEIVYKGKVVGQHKGLWFYTIGERKGIEIDKKMLKQMGFDTANMPPMYVVDKDKAKNQIIVGKKDECSTNKITIKSLDFARDDCDGKMFVRIRNLGELYAVSQCHSVNGDTWEIVTKEPMFAPAEGQSAVLYARMGSEGDEVVVGGGEIG